MEKTGIVFQHGQHFVELGIITGFVVVVFAVIIFAFLASFYIYRQER